MNTKRDCMEVLKYILMFGFLNTVSSSSGWSYEGSKGPGKWKDMSGNEACGGKKQSPINVDVSRAQYRESLGTFSFTGYSSNPSSLKLVNNGHTAQVNFQGTGIKVSGGGLPGEYIAAQYHFHWGSSNSKGSEHLISNKQFPMEVHIVHYSTRFGSLGEAADKPEGLAVLGFMFEVSGGDNPALAKLIAGLDGVQNKGVEINLGTFSLDSFLPENRDDFFRYSGSLTTPGCFESVVWTVFRDTIKLSQKQLDVFRKLKGNEGNIVNNFRPVQALNDRQIFSSLDNSADKRISISFTLLLCFAAIGAILSKY